MTLELDNRDMAFIEDALVQYIDYLKDGDDNDKVAATKAEQTYNKIIEQEKWA